MTRPSPTIGDILDAGRASSTSTGRYDRCGERAKALATADHRFPLPHRPGAAGGSRSND